MKGKPKPAPLGQVLTDAGYSKALANNPQRVMESKAIQELMNECGLSMERVAQSYNELLDIGLNKKETRQGIKIKDRLRLLNQITKIHLAGERRKIQKRDHPGRSPFWKREEG
jgi:hypothetical protein